MLNIGILFVILIFWPPKFVVAPFSVTPINNVQPKHAANSPANALLRGLSSSTNLAKKHKNLLKMPSPNGENVSLISGRIVSKALEHENVPSKVITSKNDQLAESNQPKNGGDMVPTLPLNSGYPMPQLGLGTWLCKSPLAYPISSGDELKQFLEVGEIVRNAVRSGYRHLDCAHLYKNQAEIGAALKELMEAGEVKREDLFITSKVWKTFHSFERASLSVDLILEQLGLDYLDLCLIHWPVAYREGDEFFPRDEAGNMLLSDIDFLETWRALEAKVAQEKVRSIGLSNFNSAQIQRVIDEGSIRPAVLQVECHPFFQQRKLRDFCANNGIQFVAYSPLVSSSESPLFKSEYPSVFRDPTIAQIAAARGKSAAQIVLRFLTQLSFGVIPRSRNLGRQRENFQIFDFELSAQEMTELEKLETGKRTMYRPSDAFSPHFPFGAECPDDRGL